MTVSCLLKRHSRLGAKNRQQETRRKGFEQLCYSHFLFPSWLFFRFDPGAFFDFFTDAFRKVFPRFLFVVRINHDDLVGAETRCRIRCRGRYIRLHGQALIVEFLIRSEGRDLEAERIFEKLLFASFVIREILKTNGSV